MTDVLFINPPSPDKDVVIRDINRSGRKTRERMIWPQTNLAYMAAMLKDRFSVEIIDCIAMNIKWDKLRKILEEKKPKYIVGNIISTTLTNDMYLIFLAKSMDIITIGTGPHVTELYESVFQQFPSLDYVIRGEGEFTLKELVNTIEDGNNPKKVKGIAYRDGKELIVTDERPFIENLDDLPMPLHELLPLNKYRLPFFGKYTFIVASRGCPFKCIFCRQIVMWKGKVRVRSAQSLFEETKYVLSLGVKNIMYQADTFTVDKKMIIELCKKIIDAGLKFKWCCNTHIACIDKEMISWMKKAGCWMIAPGIESGSDIVLKNIRKQITRDQIIKNIKILKDAKIQVWGYFVFGLPGDTWESLMDNVQFAIDLKLDMANFAVGAPYPGTEFYTMAKEKGWLQTTKWEEFDQNYSAIVDYGTLTPAQIIKAMKIANFRFFTRPKPIAKILWNMMKDPIEIRDMVIIIWTHVKWIFSKKDEVKKRDAKREE